MSNVVQKLDNVIASLDGKINDEKKDDITVDDVSEHVPQNPSDYDLTKPYHIITFKNDKGGPEKLRIKNITLPEVLNDNDVLISVKACGINFIDTYHRSGLYPNVDNIGKEGSGLIIKIGKNVTKYKVNDQVLWHGIQGSYATHVISNENNKYLMNIPDIFKNNDNIYTISASLPILIIIPEPSFPILSTLGYNPLR